jgi:choline dehydrogenase
MINGLNYIRADAAQIDAWEALGAVGWNWASLWPYYNRSERFVPPTAEQQARGATYREEFHGKKGEVEVGWLENLGDEEFYNAVKDTWALFDVQPRDDANGGILGGFSLRPWTVDVQRQERVSAATAFYYPVATRSNLRVLNGTVKKLIWGSVEDGEQVAVGVEYLDHNRSNQVLRLGDTGEVVLSAGTLRSPPILEASGIGNPAILTKIGIDVKVDLPGVGENFQDQANFLMKLKASSSSGGSEYTPYAAWVTARQLFGNSVEEIAK